MFKIMKTEHKFRMVKMGHVFKIVEMEHMFRIMIYKLKSKTKNCSKIKT